MKKRIDDLGKSYFGLRVSDGAGVFVAGFVFLYIFQIILLLIAQATKIDINNAPVWFTYITMFVNQLALICAVVAYGKIARKQVLSDCRITQKITYKQGLIIPVICIFCIFAFLPIANGFVQLIGMFSKKPPTVSISIGTQWWEILLSIIFVSVLPAVGEEILFRGGVARSLKRKNYLFAIIVSGLMFSIFHGNAAQTVHQFLIGMVFAYLYFASGSLLASIIAHLVNNVLAIVLELAFSGLNINLSYGVYVTLQVVGCIVGFVGLYFLLRYFMKLSKQAKNIDTSSTSKNAWATDFVNAFTINGIKENYQKFNNSLKMLFDDPCDCIDINGDIQVENQTLENDADKKDKEDEMQKLLIESNKATIKKRNRFDVYALIAAIGIALAVWILNLIQLFK